MAFPRTWSEELVAEWLELDGYFVKTGIPVAIDKGGGRKGIDVLGIRLREKKLQFFHIEIGTTAQKNFYQIIQEKFEDEKVKKEIENIAEEFGHKLNECDLKRGYIHVWRKLKKRSDNVKEELGKKGIELKTFGDLESNIKASIKDWKEKHNTKKGHLPELPENLWLLKMFDTLIHLEPPL